MPEITLPNTDPFFKVNDWGDTLTTGETLKIVHQAVSRWVTTVYGKPTPLPKTGY